MDQKRTYTPEEAQAVRDAFLLAKRTFSRQLTQDENTRLAMAVMHLAANGCAGVNQLATKAVISALNDSINHRSRPPPSVPHHEADD
jgi:hypothetical protein